MTPESRLPGRAAAGARRYAGAGALLAALATSACATVPADPVALPDLDAKRLNAGIEAPLVHVGDQFVFNNPDQLWEVMATEGPYIAWRDGAGNELLTSHNPIYPALQWNGTAQAGRRAIKDIDGSLFPLAQGNSVTFEVEGQADRPPAVWRAKWQCVVQDRQPVTVPAGKAEVWPVLCMRNGREEFLFQYDPEIGNYVQVATFVEGKAQVRQLTTFRRGPTRPAP